MTIKNSIQLAAVGMATLTTAALAEPAKLSGSVTDVFGPRFVLETPTGKILVEVGPKGQEKFSLKQGDKVDVEGDLRAKELRARRVTLSDGHAYTVGKNGRTWREWLTGGKPNSVAQGPFGPAEAKKVATDAGYTVSGEPSPNMRHFKVMASKGGKDFDLQIFRDGRLDPQPRFGMSEAKKIATDKGYQLTADPVAAKTAMDEAVDRYRSMGSLGGVTDRAPVARLLGIYPPEVV